MYKKCGEKQQTMTETQSSDKLARKIENKQILNKKTGLMLHTWMLTFATIKLTCGEHG